MGVCRTTESTVLSILRKIEEEGLKANPGDYRLEEFLASGAGESKEEKPSGKGGVFGIFGKKP